MHKLLKFSVILWLCFLYNNSSAQQTIYGSIMHDSQQRDYILYIPDSYTGDEEVPLILNFHGYTSTATEQMFYGDFRQIADTANFLVVHPEGTLLNGASHWNVGGWTINSTVDDLGFTSALIDSLSSYYNIDEEHIYATGMSNGGFMSFLLACQLSDRIAAIASVTGSMTPEIYNECNPSRQIPILQIHGTADPVVPYAGAFFTNSIEEVIQYWQSFNNCNPEPVIDALPDIEPTDGSTVEHIKYTNQDSGIAVEHYKIFGGQHTWPGTAFPQQGTNFDFNASEVIWDFFRNYNINGILTDTDDNGSLLHSNEPLKIFPNPAMNHISIINQLETEENYHILNAMGEIVQSGTINPYLSSIDVSGLNPSIYFLKTKKSSIRFIKQ